MDVLLFRSYISTVLDYAYGVFKRDSHEEFNGMTLVTIAMQRRAVDPSIVGSTARRCIAIVTNERRASYVAALIGQLMDPQPGAALLL